MRLTVSRSFGAIAGALLLTALSAGTAVAAAQDQVTGSGRFDSASFSGQLIINAHGTPLDAQGNIRLNIPGFANTGATVTCLSVVGNTATLSGTLEKPIGDWTYIQVTVVDNGTPGDGSAPDLADFALSAREFSCIEPELTPSSEVQQGNFTVIDGQDR